MPAVPRSPRRPPVPVAVLMAVLVALLVGCGSGGAGEETSGEEGAGTASGASTAGGDSSESGGELPSEVRAASLKELTGVAAFAGESASRGIQLAVEEINASDELLASTQLVVDERDTASETQTAASQFTEIASGGEYSAVFGPLLSASAQAIAPLANQQQMPVIFTQAGSEGVVTGEYTFRATAPMPSYYPIITDYLAEQDLASMAVIYLSDNPTLAEVATGVLPQLADEQGFEITASIGVSSDTQDFAGPIANALEGDPDGITILLIGAQNATAMTQLRQAGFDGPVIGNTAAAAGALQPAAEAATGLTWPAGFHWEMQVPEAQQFVEAYREEFDENPLNYAAEGYDAVYWLARALERAGSVEPQAVQEGLAAVAEEGFTGTQGELTFEGNDLRVPGVLVQWDGSDEILLQGPSGSDS